MTGVIDRCPTGIEGFDKMCNGGFVRNSDNLIIGGPGSGKSTFLLQFLWNGITKFNENGLYCSFEPDIVDTLGDAMTKGWDFSRMSAEGKIKFMRFSPGTSIDELKSELTRMISKNDVKRVCFDPISVLALDQGDIGKMRQKIFDVSSLMKRLKVTTLFADESLDGEGIERPANGDWTKTDILKFLSDSVTLFYDFGLADVGDRAVRITKMRRTDHLRKPIGMKIGDKGVELAVGYTPLNTEVNPESVVETTQEVVEEVSPPEESVEIVKSPSPNTQGHGMNVLSSEDGANPNGDVMPEKGTDRVMPKSGSIREGVVTH